ncbi:putative ribonuclease H-like domain-containing protein, partial [Tanacetum coccineum]
FTWVFFLTSKDETSGIFKNFITEIENLVDKKVKIIRCNNGTEFKNRVMNEFCQQKCIKREYSVARTPQQNGVAKRRNRTLIEAARTMLADYKLPIIFWAEVVNIACYVQNRVLIVKPHNKTPYELFRGRTPALSFMRPFGCHVTILNTLDHLNKFDGKSDDGFFVGYSLTSKAFRVYNIRTRKVEENLHIRFLEDKPIVLGDGPKWLFDIDSLTKSINYVPVIAGINSNDFADSSLFDSPSINVSHDEPEPSCDAEKKDDEGVGKASGVDDQERPESSTPNINTTRSSINTTSTNLRTGSLHINTVSPTVLTTRSNRPQTVSDIFSLRYNVTPEATNVDLFSDETKMGMSKLNASYQVPTTPNTRIHKDHSLDHVIGDIQSGEEPKRVTKALSDSAWVKAMQEELLQFKLQKGYTQEEGIDYDEVFAPVARIKAIRLFLAYASFTGFMVYQMDVKSAFFYGQIEEEVYVDDIIFGSTKKKLCIEFEKLMHDKFQMSSMGELTFFLGLQVKQKEDGIFISQDKYVTDILKKFGFQDVRTTSTPMDTEKPLLKDSDGDDVDVHLYKLMIGSLMYLTSSRLDIMFAVCLWYPRDSPFDLVAYSDSDYAGASLDRKSTTGGCQFLGCRLISWQCKKQTVVATSSTEAEYVAAASCCGQVLWIQNQMLDYGYNFMHTMINIDNNSTICIVKNPVSHTKTKHIEIRYHFIRDCNDKKLIQVVKIHTDNNFADLLTKALDVGRISTDKQIECLKLNASPLKIVKRGRDTKIPQSSSPPLKVGDEVVHKELGDRMERAATIASSLESEKDSVMVVTQLKTITKASLRRHLKLANADGISSLPNTKIFKQLALMGSKKTAWEQFSSNIATAIICLATNRTFNFSKMIFKGMVKNLDNRSKFLMYPRFIQILLNKHQRLLLPHKRNYVAPTLTQKLFSNMRRVSKGYTRVNILLFSSMLVQSPIQQGEGSTVLVEFHHTPITTPYTSQLPLSSPSRVPTSPYDSPLPGVASLEQDLKQTKKVYGNTYTKLIMRVKKLEHKVKSRQPRRREIVVISDTEKDLEDPSKQGRRIGRTSADTEILLDQEEPTELVEDLEDEYVHKKAKKQLEQERLGHEEAIRLQEHINEEERQRIARDAEIAKQLQEEFDRARQEQEVVAEVDQARNIDWSDPAVLRYHALQNRSFSVAEVRKNMCIVWDQNHAFVPKDSEIEKEVMKRPGFDFPQNSIKKSDKIKASGFVQKQLAEEEKEKKNDASQQQAGSIKKRSREDSDEDNAKKQMLEDDAEKEEFRDSMDVVPRDDIAINVESLATKYPIVDWKTHVLTKNMMYYQIIRADGNSKNYKIFSEMLDDFDRQDVMDLHKLVQESYDTTSLEGYDLLLWGDLKILFEPNEEDEIWKNQQDYNLIS